MVTLGTSVGFQIDTTNNCPCPPRPPFPPCPPQPIRPIVVDDNVPYNPATYADVEDVLRKLHFEMMERVRNDNILSETICAVNNRVTELSGAVFELSGVVANLSSISGGGGGGLITVDPEISLTSTNPVQNKAIASCISTLSSDISTVASSVSSLSGNAKAVDDDFATKIASLSSTDGTIDARVTELSGVVASIPSITVDDVLSDTSTNPVQNKVIASSLEGKLDADAPAIGLSGPSVTVTLSGDSVEVSGELLVDHGITMTRNGEQTNDIVTKGYHFKYMDCTHEDKDGCIDFYLADGLWSYGPLIDLWNDVHDESKPEISLEDGHGVFDSTWKSEWDGILEGTKSEFQYRTTGNDTFTNINPTMFLRNSSNYDLCLELVALVGNKATCRLVGGLSTTVYAAVGTGDTVAHQEVIAGTRAPYEGSRDAWEQDYKDDKDRVSDMYTLRFTLNNIGGSIIARNQCAFGQANQTTGYSTQAFGCENIVSGKWGGTFGFGLHQLAWGENVYGRFNKTPTTPRPNGIMKYPVIIGCGLTSTTRRDGLKFDRQGDAIFDGNISSKTLSDIGVQHIRKTFTGKTAIKLYPTEADALASTNQITTAINFRQPTVNSANTVMVIASSGGGVFWSSAYSLREGGTVKQAGATYAIRATLNSGSRATQAEFDAGSFERAVYAKGKFFLTGTLGLFWSEDGKTWTQSATVPTGANEFLHFHNKSIQKWWHLSYDGGDFFTKSLPNGDEKVTTLYTKLGAAITGKTLIKTDTGYAVIDGGETKATSFVGGDSWWRDYQDIFMLGNMITFDPTDDDAWFGGTTFVGGFASVGAFVNMNAGAGAMLGIRGYCNSSDTGAMYSVMNFTDDNKISFEWKACGGSSLKGIHCDNLTGGVDKNGASIVVFSPLSKTSAATVDMQPYYVRGGGTSLSAAAFPAPGIPMETSFITNDGSVIVMLGTGAATGSGFYWTNYLDGTNTVWHRSNIKKLPWTTPQYLESLDMYTTIAYYQTSNVLISRDAKYWVKTAVESIGMPPVEFAGKVIFSERGGTDSTLTYLTVTDTDETYNLGTGGGGSLEDVEQITGNYTDKIVRAKVNEIIVALGGELEQIPEEYTDEDIKNKVNEIILAYS